MSQENVESVRAAYDAYNRADLDAALKDVAPECELVSDHVASRRAAVSTTDSRAEASANRSKASRRSSSTIAPRWSSDEFIGSSGSNLRGWSIRTTRHIRVERRDRGAGSPTPRFETTAKGPGPHLPLSQGRAPQSRRAVGVACRLPGDALGASVATKWQQAKPAKTDWAPHRTLLSRNPLGLAAD